MTSNVKVCMPSDINCYREDGLECQNMQKHCLIFKNHGCMYENIFQHIVN